MLGVTTTWIAHVPVAARAICCQVNIQVAYMHKKLTENGVFKGFYEEKMLTTD
jgi:hypothetical protein